MALCSVVYVSEEVVKTHAVLIIGLLLPWRSSYCLEPLFIYMYKQYSYLGKVFFRSRYKCVLIRLVEKR